MALPNPSFEPKTHQWRPGAWAPSREVPSQICAILGQKRPFFAYYTPLPLNLTNNKQQQQATSTSPCRFGHCPVPTFRILCRSSHLGALVVPLPNPSFEPKTHRWRPGAWAPSREVPSQSCGVLGQNGHFSPKIAPQPGRNAQAKENGGYTSRAA